MDKQEIELKLSTNKLPLDYILLKWRLIINQELYENYLIDIYTFHHMEESLISRLTKILSR